jgi:hypothetical protein
MTFGQRNNVPVLQWKRQLCQELLLCIQAILYDEETRPELFAYFIQGRSWSSFGQYSWQCIFGMVQA